MPWHRRGFVGAQLATRPSAPAVSQGHDGVEDRRHHGAVVPVGSAEAWADQYIASVGDEMALSTRLATVHRWFLRLSMAGVFERLAHTLTLADCERAGREPSLTGAILDAQAARSGVRGCGRLLLEAR